MPRLGVLGWPVAHSRSPAMHNAALRELGLSGWRYQLLPVPPELFEDTARALPGAGFVGANVTIPHKQAALRIAEQVSDPARAIGAANTLTFGEHGEIAAENTDAPALIAALPVSPRGMRALVLGAGGSARSSVWALLAEGATEVLVWNRTRERAVALANDLGARAVEVPEPAELLVNCTSVGLGSGAEAAEIADRATREAPQEPVQPSASALSSLNQLRLTFDQLAEYRYVVDMVYRAGSTPLLSAARAHGAVTVDGLELLVAQGALSLELWTGMPAPVQTMRAAAHEERGD